MDLNQIQILQYFFGVSESNGNTFFANVSSDTKNTFLEKVAADFNFRYRYILNFLPLFLIANTQIKYALSLALRKGQLLFDFIVQLSKDKGP